MNQNFNSLKRTFIGGRVEKKALSSIIVIAIVVVISIFTVVALVWLRVEKREQNENVGYVHLLLENYVELSGKVKGFTTLSEPPFFRFFTEVNSVQYEVIGGDQVIFLDNVISPIFSGISVKWDTHPLVKIFGKKIDNNTILAYTVDENIHGVLKNWYYKSFLNENDRWDILVLGTYYAEKLVWVNGLLTNEDLLFFLANPDNYFPFQVPSPYLGKEAYANCTVHVYFGTALAVENLFVKQDNSYIRIFP
jgi:hypothetical protein